MAFTRQNVTLTNPAGSGFQVAIGNQSFTFDADDLRAIWNGRRDVGMLLFQMLIVLQQANINPNTATLAQLKAAVEAQTYWWGNS